MLETNQLGEENEWGLAFASLVISGTVGLAAVALGRGIGGAP
jgi:fluoride ion exporter CrcB/FEX